MIWIFSYRCSTYYCNLRKDNILLIQDIFPVTENYIAAMFVKNGVHQRIASENEQKIILKKANKIIALMRYKGKLFPSQADVIEIEKKLLEKINSE